MEVDRADGCFLGQLAVDAFGSLVEFHSPEENSCNYPEGVWNLDDDGAWNSIAG